MEKILVVENSQDISQSLKSLFENAGYFVVTCSGYGDLWNSISKNECFLAIVDMEIPDGQWEESVDLLKEVSIPVIIYSRTGYSAQLRDKFREKRILDYVSKESRSSFGELLGIVDRLMANRLIKVLLVDDSTSARQLGKFILEQAKFNVFEAGDGMEALGILEREKDIRIVITDFEMPHMNGYDLVRIIRKQYDKNSLSIIGVSHPSTTASSASFLKSGANDFIRKPYSIEEFYCRVVTQAELLESFQLVSELNGQKNNIIGMIAHDIRVPVASIQSVCRKLLDKSRKDMSDHIAAGLSAMDQTSDRMLHLLEDLLKISSLEKGKSALEISSESMPRIVEERLENQFFERARKKEIFISFKHEKLSDISFDKSRITQVIDNLVSNSVKFTPKGGKIVINLKEEYSRQIFSIWNNGPSMSQYDKDHAFLEFQKLSAKPTGGESSTGLGLAICRKIIQLHNGHIWINSDRGKGAEFCFSLPFTRSGI